MSSHDSDIRFNNVSFGWDRHKPLFQNLDLTITTTKTILLTGENGSGKSTFASLAAGLILPVKGNICRNNITFDSKHRRKIYQQLAYLQQKSEQNLIGIDADSDLKLWALASPNVHARSKMSNTGLLEWGLEEIRHRPVWELSSGELKRLCLAGLSLNLNKYWILDEPEVSLDTQYCQKLVTLLLNKQMNNPGILIITNNPNLYSNLKPELWQITSTGTDGQMTSEKA
jgi:cobalt/nickel transport system ATP-binding protein